MLNVALCFHVHQPYRLGHIRVYDRTACGEIFDDALNRAMVERVTRVCYLPAGELFCSLIERYGPDFKIALSITGTVVEQLRDWAPEAREQFRKLAGTGSLEFIGETYYHSLFSLFDREEFVEQVHMHLEMLKDEYDLTPQVFRNTELLYDDRVSDYLSAIRQFRVVLCEDAAAGCAISGRPCRSYNERHMLLPRNHVLTDDIAFRFQDREWSEYPLTAEKFTARLERYYEEGGHDHDRFLLLYMDYETLGEHILSDSGIFQFFEHLAEIILLHDSMRFVWPSEVRSCNMETLEKLFVKHPVSWADSKKDHGAWLSSDLQRNAMGTLLEMVSRIRSQGDADLLETVRRLSSSDHFYCMFPWKGDADAEVHRHFSSYGSPEDAYVRYLNALTVLEQHLE